MVIKGDIDVDLDLSGLDELEREMEWLDDQVVEYGFLDPARIHPTAEVPVAQVAVWNNYGTKGDGGKKWHIPPRPFFDLAELYVEDLLDSKFARRIGQSFLEGRASYTKALDFIGKESAEQIQFAIDEGDYKALAPSTIRLKGSDTILINSGFMYNSVSSKLTTEKE